MQEDKAKAAGHTIGWIAVALVVIGAINWALVGLFGFDLVAAIFGHATALTRFVYVLVGIAGLYLIGFTRMLVHETDLGHPRPVT